MPASPQTSWQDASRFLQTRSWTAVTGSAGDYVTEAALKQQVVHSKAMRQQARHAWNAVHAEFKTLFVFLHCLLKRTVESTARQSSASKRGSVAYADCAVTTNCVGSCATAGKAGLEGAAARCSFDATRYCQQQPGSLLPLSSSATAYLGADRLKTLGLCQRRRCRRVQSTSTSGPLKAQLGLWNFNRQKAWPRSVSRSSPLKQTNRRL